MKQKKLESFFTLKDNNSVILPTTIVKPLLDDIISAFVKGKKAHNFITCKQKSKQNKWCASFPWLDVLFGNEETVGKKLKSY